MPPAEFDSTMLRAFAGRLIRWFHRHQRRLPWRRSPRDPYHVWLSEVMLQQTQVATVIPYFERWIKRFPSLRAFADAPLDDVLKVWEGLGYYSRARNFHRAAQIVMRDFDGQMPRTAAELLQLPGIGRYTAGAIASLAFDEHVPLLDGNVKRVLARVHALSTPSDDELWRLAEVHLPTGRAATFNEALMELGALVCTPRTPKCDACPVNRYCQAFASGDPEAFPTKVPKKITPHHDVLTAVIVNERGQVLMGQRPRDGLLGGLWEFVSSEFRAAHRELADVVRERTGLQINDLDGEAEMIGTVKHAFTHFKITRQVWLVTAHRVASPHPNGYDQLRWVPLDHIKQLALTRSDQKILALYEKHRLSLFA